MRKRIGLIVGVVISAVSLYIVLRDLNLAKLWSDLQGADYIWIIPGVVVYFFGVWARTWRWHYLLRPLKPVSLGRLFPVVTIGYFGNNVYPARAGEVIRSYVLRRREGISMSASLATILVERIFDGLVMLLFVFVALPLVKLEDWLRNLVILASLAFFGALIVFFVVAAVPHRALALYDAVAGHLLPAGLHLKARGLLERFTEGLHALRNWREVLMIFVTSTVIWLAETVKYWFVMHAFHFEVSFFVLMLMNGVVNLATTVPSAPGYVGTFDGPGIKILESFSVPGTIAAAYTLTLHAALWLPITAVGAYFMWREGLSWRSFDDAGTAAKNAPPDDRHVDQEIATPATM